MGLAALFGASPVRADSPAVPLRRRTDIVLHSEKTYENPYMEVEIDAVFTHEDGDTVSLYGFWNGGDEWRVRFAPTKTGRWDYAVRCSDPENRGLDGVKGFLIAAENGGETEVDRHGFVRVSENGRGFSYEDGTPFFSSSRLMALSQPHGDIVFIPSHGTLCSTPWNMLFHPMEHFVPPHGTNRCLSLSHFFLAYSTFSTSTTSPSSAHKAGRNPRSARSCLPACGAVKLLILLAKAISCSGLKMCKVVI